MTAAVTLDIVGSRLLPDRSLAQQVLDAATARVDDALPIAVTPLRPTVGDELQGVYPSLEAAMAATLLLQLTLPDGVQCRFGIGDGPVGEVASATGPVTEGPGWWAAREAIDTVHALARRTAPRARTRVATSEDSTPAKRDRVRLANAYLLTRDELVGSMSERARRLTYGRCLATTQRELAAQEGITQSAVSQILSVAGSSSIVLGFRMLRDAH